MMPPRFKVLLKYPEKCVGCRICELVCSLTKEGIVNPKIARIKVRGRELASIPQDLSIYDIQVCSQCRIPICIDVCGRNAMKRDVKTNAMLIDSSLCNNCGKCEITCPLHAIRPLPRMDIVRVCDLCGGDPACVKYCPTGALEYEKPLEAVLERYTLLWKKIEHLYSTEQRCLIRGK